MRTCLERSSNARAQATLHAEPKGVAPIQYEFFGGAIRMRPTAQCPFRSCKASFRRMSAARTVSNSNAGSQQIRCLCLCGKVLAGILIFIASSLIGNGMEQRHAPSMNTHFYQWDPYLYQERQDGVAEWVGLDKKLTDSIFQHAGMRYTTDPASSWPALLNAIKDGTRDFALGTFLTEERLQFAYFSVPYRYENTMLYLPRGQWRAFRHASPADLFKRLHERQQRLGVVHGWSYTAQVDDYLSIADEQGILVYFDSEEELAPALLGQEIDAYLCSQISGQTLLWRNNMQDRIQTYPAVLARSPIHLMFSQASVEPEQVARINEGLEASRRSGDYARIVRNYIFPILLSITVETDWFWRIDLLGTIAFSLSGVLLGRKEHYSLFGTLLLAALPAVGGGIIRDLLIDRHPISLFRTPYYLLAIILTTLTLYSGLRLWDWTERRYAKSWFKHLQQCMDQWARQVMNGMIQIFDAVGLAAFTVSGVVVAVESQLEPLCLWAPCLAALTGAGGGIVRDVVRSDSEIQSLKGAFYAEIALIWGLVFSLYLTWTTHLLNSHHMFIAVLIVLIGTFLTRLAAMLFNIKSPMF